jgi:hypothetical protein
LYVVNVLIGFALALAFVLLLLWFDIANLRHLILGSDQGWLAFGLLVLSNGIVFAGAQFAIAVMRMAEDGTGPRGGHRAPKVVLEPIPVLVTGAERGPRPMLRARGQRAPR